MPSTHYELRNKRPTYKPRFQTNAVELYNNLSRGSLISRDHEVYKSTILKGLNEMKPFKTMCKLPFRITSIAWHPNHSTLLAAASKRGNLYMCKYNQIDTNNLIPWTGPESSVLALKFTTDAPHSMYLATYSGYIMNYNFEENKVHLLLSKPEASYCSLDIKHKLVIAGDSSGNIELININGLKVWKLPLDIHNKVTHLEFHPQNENIFVSSSNDHAVKLWDIRNISDKNSALFTFPHKKIVNSAVFSLTNGHSILTTDQFNEIRVYQAPFYAPPTIINHPHRMFQYLTPIKANWHPLQDLVVVGRYPQAPSDSNPKKTIDIIDPHVGEIMLQKWAAKIDGISSLTSFNTTGDALMASTGHRVIVWN